MNRLAAGLAGLVLLALAGCGGGQDDQVQNPGLPADWYRSGDKECLEAARSELSFYPNASRSERFRLFGGAYIVCLELRLEEVQRNLGLTE